MRVRDTQAVTPASTSELTSTAEKSEPLSEKPEDVFEGFAPNPLARLYAPQKSVFVSKLIDWKNAVPTWPCHWWPKRAHVFGGDPINNVFGRNGPLAKFDQAFSKDSQNFELKHNLSSSLFIGHSREAVRVSAFLHEPKRSVVYNGVEFSPHHISGLLCKVVGALTHEDMGSFGKENTPVAFLDDLLWATHSNSKSSFSLIIEDGGHEREVPYDQVTVLTSSKKSDTPGNKRNEYEAVLKSTGYPDQERRYHFWIEHNAEGVPQDCNWLVDSSQLPELIVRVMPKGELGDRATWSGLKAPDNPEISLDDVFEIYRLSI